jgi:hypothetical protein
MPHFVGVLVALSRSPALLDFRFVGMVVTVVLVDLPLSTSDLAKVDFSRLVNLDKDLTAFKISLIRKMPLSKIAKNNSPE